MQAIPSRIRFSRVSDFYGEALITWKCLVLRFGTHSCSEHVVIELSEPSGTSTRSRWVTLP